MIHVPAGSDLELDVQLEEVTGGVLVTASVTAQLAGECARCLDEFTSVTKVRFRELFADEVGGSGDDGYLLDGDLLDLEPALRDAVVLELPLSPLCAADCPGLCSKCGVRLADAEPGHGHPDDGGVWAVLAVLKDSVPGRLAEAGTAGAMTSGTETSGTETARTGTVGQNGQQDAASSDGATGPVDTQER